MVELPLEITFRDVSESETEALESHVRRKAATLEKFYDHIMSCRIAVEKIRDRHSPSDPHRVRVDITVPRGNEIVVTEQDIGNRREDPKVIISRAFEVAKRQLKQLKERQRYEVKTHEEPRGLVVRLFKEEGYGFLRTLDGQELYFHRNSVLDGNFDRLEIGTEVRYAEEAGEKGPQASTVQIVAKPGARHTKVSRDADIQPPPEWRDE